jgi:hypothetical protein
MSALEFVTALVNSGRVRVPVALEPPDDLSAAVRELDRFARPELAFEPPLLDLEVGQWALLLLFRGCQALVYRELDAEAVRAALAVSCPAAVSAEACYSADLAFRFLPDLIRLARGIAEDDPLVEGLKALAVRWPLSSVGVKDLGAVDLAAFAADPSLMRLYCDRIIETRDLSRLDDARTREAVREALGAFGDLAPVMAAALGKEGDRVAQP